MKPAALVLALALGVPAGSAFAENAASPYTGQETRAIKALSDSDVAALLKGEGIGMAKAAELNGYPGPAHVLARTVELKLSAPQRQQVQAVFDRMSAAAKPLGAELVAHEWHLD